MKESMFGQSSEAKKAAKKPANPKDTHNQRDSNITYNKSHNSNTMMSNDYAYSPDFRDNSSYNPPLDN